MRKLNLSAMANQTLKVVVPKIEPPYLNTLNYTHAYSQQIRYGPGIVWQLLRDMADHLNLTFDVESLENEGWGQKLANGSWTGSFGRLQNGEAEILAGGSMMTPDRNAAFDFSIPIGYQSSGILIRVPKRKNFVAKMLVQAFDWKIWFSTIFCFLLAMFAFCYIQRKLAKCSKIEQKFDFSDSMFIFFSIFTKQQINTPPKSISARTLIATLWIASIFLMASFGASVISLFAHGTSKLPFETLEELIHLVKEGEWKLVLDMKSTGRIEIIEVFSSDPVFSKLMNDPERVIFVDGLENGVKTVQHYSGNSAFVAPSGRLFIMSQLECNVTMLPNHILPTYLSIAFRKGSPYRHYLNKRILDFWQNGLLRRWIKKYSAGRYSFPSSHNFTKCTENWDDRLRKGIFGLLHFESIFIVLSIGLAFSIVVFIFEKLTII